MKDAYGEPDVCLSNNWPKVDRDYCRIIGDPKIHAGARVDAFCVLTGPIQLDEGVHVACGAKLLGTSGVLHLQPFSFASMNSVIITASDSYTAGNPMNPEVPEDLRNIFTGDVIFEPFSGIGAHTTVMPDVVLGYGAVVGAHSFVRARTRIPQGEVWAGVPAKKVGVRDLAVLTQKVKIMRERGYKLPIRPLT